MDNIFGVLFFGLFELLGGAAIGAGLRGLFSSERSGAEVFLLIWGSGFGGIPLLISSATFISAGQPVYFLAGFGIFIGAIALAFLIPRDMSPSFSKLHIRATFAGGILTLGGAILLAVSLRGGFGNGGVVLGALLFLIGAALLIRTAYRILQATPEELAEEPPDASNNGLKESALAPPKPRQRTARRKKAS